MCSIKSVRDDILKTKIYQCIKQYNESKSGISSFFSMQPNFSLEIYTSFVEKVFIYDDNNIKLQFKEYEGEALYE